MIYDLGAMKLTGWPGRSVPYATSNHRASYERSCWRGWPGRSVPCATSTRSAAARAGFRREIDSQAGLIERRPVVEMAPPIIAIRWGGNDQ
jgi:hypothetical protein